VRLAEGQIRPVLADHSYGSRQAMNDPDPEKSKAVVQAMLKMSKIVIEDLKKAYDGKAAA
jgi:hypothetical protein